ncbi:MAG: cell division protein ZapA [Muribaculaceae bacterium]|nr:cell division protein ZapA [Muribaculaceae bacterium]
MTDRQLNITIRIADLPRIPLRIPQREEEVVRRAEANINSLWEKWSAMDEFREKSSAEVLAMVTFRFAQLYYSNLEASQKLDAMLQGLEKELDSLLLQDITQAVHPHITDGSTDED